MVREVILRLLLRFFIDLGYLSANPSVFWDKSYNGEESDTIELDADVS